MANTTLNMNKEVLDLKLEIHFLNAKLKDASIYAVDLQMIDQLACTMELINNLLANPMIINTSESLDVNFVNKLQIHRQLYCKDCNVSLKGTIEKIKEHMDSKKHKKPFGPKLVSNVTISPTGQVFCTEVAGKPTNESPTKKRSESERSESAVIESSTKLSKKVKAFLKDVKLENFAQKLVDQGKLIKESKTHDIVVDDLTKALCTSYPEVKVYPFGSRISGLGGVNSDLDVFVDLNFSYFSTPLVMNSQVMRKIEEILRSTKDWNEFLPILQARTPILRAFNKQAKVDCDLSFSNGLSHCNTKLISYFVELNPSFAKVAGIAKYFAQEADFKMNSYIIVLLVVFYFQTEKYLPPVYVLQNNIEPRLVGAWQGNFDSMYDWPIKNDEFRKQLIGFFDYYSKFDFKRYVVCPFVGQPMKKSSFVHNREQLPKEFNLYLQYMKKLDLSRADPLVHLFAYEKDLCVQDPMELIHNVAKGVRKHTLERFVNYCRLGAELLKNKKII